MRGINFAALGYKNLNLRPSGSKVNALAVLPVSPFITVYKVIFALLFQDITALKTVEPFFLPACQSDIT